MAGLMVIESWSDKGARIEGIRAADLGEDRGDAA